jgi:hypothetical protein
MAEPSGFSSAGQMGSTLVANCGVDICDLVHNRVLSIIDHNVVAFVHFVDILHLVLHSGADL